MPKQDFIIDVIPMWVRSATDGPTRSEIDWIRQRAASSFMERSLCSGQGSVWGLVPWLVGLTDGFPHLMHVHAALAHIIPFIF